jgi:Uma2 family endonuclease
MSLAISNPGHTVEEYLDIERKAEERHFYLDGVIYEMAGESLEHGLISTNLTAEVVRQLRGTPCALLSKDMKVRSGPEPFPPRSKKGLFSYPDHVVICGEIRFHDTQRDVVLNPSVIIEVLSESTEAFDRGEKFLRYKKWNPTLTDYLLVSQLAPVVEHSIRQEDEGWMTYVHRGLDRVVEIESINVKLALSLVYERVDFSDV